MGAIHNEESAAKAHGNSRNRTEVLSIYSDPLYPFRNYKIKQLLSSFLKIFYYFCMLNGN